MQKTLSNVKSLFISKHFQQLVEARDRADDVYTSNMTLGEGLRAKMLAATGATSIEEVISSAVVVKRLKRAALIQIHNLLFYANQWGVMMCTVPAKYPIGHFNMVEGPSLTSTDSSKILRNLGVIHSETRLIEGWPEALHDYSKCEESPVDWLN